MADTPAEKNVKVAVEGNLSAPFIYFDGVGALGHHGGIVQIEIAANTIVPLVGTETRQEVVAVAHLRCTFAGLAALKDAIQKVEAMLTPPDAKPN